MIGNLVLLTLMAPAVPAIQTMESAVVVSHDLGPQGQSSITGFVFDQSRRPLANLRVELLDEVDGVLANTRTNAAGQYSFYRLSTGVFQVKVWATGTDYEGKTERVSISGSFGSGRAGHAEQVDFVLTPRKARGNASASGGPGTVFVQEVPDKARLVYEQALKDLDNDKSKDKGLAGLVRAIDLFPNYYAALDLLGQQYVLAENYASAQVVLTQAVAVNPRSSSTWHTLGYAQYKLRLLPEAAESLTKATSLNNESLNTHLLLGTVLRIQKQWVPAENHLKQAKSLSKTPPAEVHWQLALLYNHIGRSAEAAAELEWFLKAQPDSRDAEQIRKLISELRKKK